MSQGSGGDNVGIASVEVERLARSSPPISQSNCVNEALGAELTEHLGYEKHDPARYNSGNSRKREHAEDGEGRFRGDGGRDFAQWQRKLRATNPTQASDAF